MPSRTYFTADTHFGHEGVIRFSKRPFSSAEEMDELLIGSWNSVVRPQDTVWHLGDFAHRSSPQRLARIFDRLKGEKHLIVGNHDDEATGALGWQSVQQIAEIAVTGQRIVLCHYAMRIWPGQRKGAIHLFGHSHARFAGTSRSLDVGVDAWGYVPVEIGPIMARLATLPHDDPESVDEDTYLATSEG